MYNFSKKFQSFIFPTRKICSRLHYTSVICCSAMELQRGKAYVRLEPENENMTISLSVNGRNRFLNRPRTEPVEKSLNRIRLSLALPMPKKDKRVKKSNYQPELASDMSEVTTELFNSNLSEEPMCKEMSNEESWSKAKLLVVGQLEYDIIYNPPTVKNIVVNTMPMAGFPLLPTYKIIFSNAHMTQWQWSRQSPKAIGDWSVIPGATSELYTPIKEEIGFKLKVTCIPVNESITGIPESFITDPVLARPKQLPFQLSQKGRVIEETLTPRFRVITYNILANRYATMESSVEGMYHYCSKKYLDMEYRKQLILREIGEYKADVICLQEVDDKVFNEYLEPHMKLQGFEGFFSSKANSSKEGCATFIRETRYIRAYKGTLVLKELFNDENEKIPEALKDFETMFSDSIQFKNSLRKLGTIAQISILIPKNKTADRPLFVVNTHLYFHPLAPHIRLIHISAILSKVKELMTSEEILEICRSIEPCLVFCGDFNSGPDGDKLDAVIELLKNGELSKSHWEWQNAKEYKWGKEESGDEEDAESENLVYDDIVGIDMRSPFVLKTAVDLSLPFTHYVGHFDGVLDYIWYEPNKINFKSMLPLPDQSQIGSYLPSETYPSDHLAVVVDLEYAEFDLEGNFTNKIISAHNDNSVSIAVECLKKSQIIAIPTDTLYGLAADASSDAAIEEIYKIKRRPEGLPLAICLSSSEEIQKYCHTDGCSDLLKELLPGPVTVVLKKKSTAPLSQKLNYDLDTLGVRIPDNSFCQKLCKAFGKAVALTSANLSGQPSSTSISDFAELWPSCAKVIDGGYIGDIRSGSTVIQLRSNGTNLSFKIFREGEGMCEILQIMRKYQIEKSD